MKSFILYSTALVLGLALFSLPSNAMGQAKAVSRGRMILGGELYYDSTSYDADHWSVDYSELRIAPEFGYFISPNLALISRVEYVEYDGDWDDSLLGFHVGARLYLPVGSFFLYGGGTVGIFSQDVFGVDMTVLEVGLHGGLLFMLTQNFGVNFGIKLGYGMGDVDHPGYDDDDLTEKFFRAGYFGVQGFF